MTNFKEMFKTNFNHIREGLGIYMQLVNFGFMDPDTFYWPKNSIFYITSFKISIIYIILDNTAYRIHYVPSEQNLWGKNELLSCKA